MCTDEMNTQWDVSVPDSTLAAYVDDVLAPLLNGKTDEKPAAVVEVKHLAPGEERTRRHTMPSIPSCTELFVTTADVSTTEAFDGGGRADLSYFIPLPLHSSVVVKSSRWDSVKSNIKLSQEGASASPPTCLEISEFFCSPYLVCLEILKILKSI